MAILCLRSCEVSQSVIMCCLFSLLLWTVAVHAMLLFLANKDEYWHAGLFTRKQWRRWTEYTVTTPCWSWRYTHVNKEWVKLLKYENDCATVVCGPCISAGAVSTHNSLLLYIYKHIRKLITTSHADRFNIQYTCNMAVITTADTVAHVIGVFVH